MEKEYKMNERHEDYCFNGFALKDMLYENSYTMSLIACSVKSVI